MYAVVKIAEQQVKVTNGLRVKVPRLDIDEGATHTINDVLLVSGEDGTQVGTPLVSGASVTATVLEQARAGNTIVFKKKRRKNYRRKAGHRQNLTVLRINDIHAAGAKATPQKTETKEAVAEKPAPKKVETKKAEAAKKTPEKKVPEKKPAKAKETKKPTAKKPAAKKAETKAKPTAKKPPAKKPAAKKTPKKEK